MSDLIRAGALWGYIQLTQNMACDPSGLLAHVALRPDDLDNPDAYLPRPAVAALLEFTAAQLACPDFGMRLAKLQDINILGALAFAIRNAPDVRQSISAASRYIHFHAHDGALSIEPLAGRHEERIAFRVSHSSQSSPQMAEHAVCLFCRIYSHLTAKLARPTRIMFAHEAQLPPIRYAEFFDGTTPQFGAAVDCVYMGRDALALPLASANRRLQALIEIYLESHAPKPNIPMADRAYAALVEIMRFGPAHIEDVADMLRMHPRTLQRRLHEDGATFERLRDEVRKDMAKRYLSHDLTPLAEIAALLGYSNQSALTRSCARWFGQSPKMVRERLRAKRGWSADQPRHRDFTG